MRNLFYNKIDETCLDSLLGFGFGQTEPILPVDNAIEDDNTINDQQLSELNLIRCLTRTEILTRIRYVINTIRPGIETIVYCLDLLIRLTRDCEFVLNKVYGSHDLVGSIKRLFVPNRVEEYEPLVEAVKFLRLLSCRSINISTDLNEKFSIMDSLSFYLTSERFSLNSKGLKLQTESLHLWNVYVSYGLSLEYLG